MRLTEFFTADTLTSMVRTRGQGRSPTADFRFPASLAGPGASITACLTCFEALTEAA